MLDIKCAGKDQSLVAIATNSEQVKVYNRDSADCSSLAGHSEVVLCLDASADGSLLLTSSKVCPFLLDHYCPQVFFCVALCYKQFAIVGFLPNLSKRVFFVGRLKGGIVPSASFHCSENF